ncbi:MAG: helix-turn-helix domain-containing protein [Deltaproteobacteria bacterium]|nr:helix-turn-helix domain-containing protein [Deltaproteobacteria bacterium]
MEAKQDKPLSPLSMGVLTQALDEEGRYDAAKLAALLDWTNQEIARYLGKDPSTISRFSASLQYQEPLAELAAIFNHLVSLMDGDLRLARAWLRTPIRVLDGVSPKEKILHSDLKPIGTLLQEVESGFSV